MMDAYERDAVDTWVQGAFADKLDPVFNDGVARARHAYVIGGMLALQHAMARWLLMLDAVRASLLGEAVQRGGRAAAVEFLEGAVEHFGEWLVPHLPHVVDRVRGIMRRAVDRSLSQPSRTGIWPSDSRIRHGLVQSVANLIQQGQLTVRDAEALGRMPVHDAALPRHLARLERRARDALRDEPRARDAFLRALRQARREVATRRDGPMGTRAIQERVVDAMTRAVDAGITQSMDDAIETFIGARLRQQSLIALRAEANRVYGDASLEMYQSHDFVVAVRWNLSPLHKVLDVCDAKAMIDIGWGAGVYPKEQVPWPDHPNGWCYLTPEYAPAEQLETARPERGPRGMDQLRRALMGGEVERMANHAGRAHEGGSALRALARRAVTQMVTRA